MSPIVPKRWTGMIALVFSTDGFLGLLDINLPIISIDIDKYRVAPVITTALAEAINVRSGQ